MGSRSLVFILVEIILKHFTMFYNFIADSNPIQKFNFIFNSSEKSFCTSLNLKFLWAHLNHYSSQSCMQVSEDFWFCTYFLQKFRKCTSNFRCAGGFLGSFFDVLWKKSLQFLCIIEKFASFCYQLLPNVIFQKNPFEIYIEVLPKISRQLRKFAIHNYMHSEIEFGDNLFISRIFFSLWLP